MNINIKKVFIIILCVVFLICIVFFLLNNFNNDFEEIVFENDEDLVLNDLDKEYLTNTEIKINKKNIYENEIIIHITGEVNNPGIVILKENSRIVDAIEAAGGITNEGSLDKVNLAYILSDGQKIYIPKINEEKNIVSDDAGENIIQNNDNSITKININTASLIQIQNLPGIGKSMAEKIIKYRNENGKFEKIEDLKKISGIGDAKLKNLIDYIYIK